MANLSTFLGTTYAGPIGATGTGGPKAISITNPSSSENVSIFFTNVALTISYASAVVAGSSPSITYSVFSGADRSVATTTHINAATVTSTTTGTAPTIAVSAIPANTWVWLQTSAASGTVTNFNLTLGL